MTSRTEFALAINGASFDQRVTGVQRYARELTSRLLLDRSARLVVPATPDDFPTAPGARVDVVNPLASFPRIGAYGWVNTVLRRSVRRHEVLWSPTVRAPLASRRHVLTVHDLSVLEHPEWFSRTVVAQWRLMVPQMCRTATAVVTDSEFSRDRLVTVLGLEPAKVTVVPCGVDERFFCVSPTDAEMVRKKLQLPDRFALSVSSVDPRKNIGLLLDAWPEVWRETGVSLVLVGGAAKNFAGSGPSDVEVPGVIRLGYVADDDLGALYAAAELLPYPSVYEGFGLPPLEAMAAGTPVVGLAATDAVAEVVGDCGVLLPDDDAKLMSEAVIDLVDSPATMARLAAKGRDRAATFTWDRAATTLSQVLHAAADSR